MADVPAFPVAENHAIASDIPWTQGMSLRDYFAGQALAGIMADSRTLKGAAAVSEKTGRNENVVVSRMAYAVADAMLAERSKESSSHD